MYGLLQEQLTLLTYPPSPAQTDGLTTFSLDSKPKGQGNGGKPKGQKKNKGASKTRHWAQDGNAPLPYCSLCGNWTHKAASGCRNMRDDNNKEVKIMPSHSVCNLCPMFVQPRLSHPPMFCLFRKGGFLRRKIDRRPQVLLCRAGQTRTFSRLRVFASLT